MTPLDAIRALVRHPPWLELAANVVNLVSIVFATRNSFHTWWTGIVGCALFGWLFFQVRLYADATLQVFFIATSVIGWWQWLHYRGQRAERPVTHMTLPHFGGVVGGAILVTVGYGWLLHRFTNAYAPFPDAALLALSVAGQLLLMQRKLETWIFWIVVNTLGVVLYAYRDLWLTMFFSVLLWINAPLGFVRWRREAVRAVEPASIST